MFNGIPIRLNFLCCAAVREYALIPQSITTEAPIFEVGRGGSEMVGSLIHISKLLESVRFHEKVRGHRVSDQSTLVSSRLLILPQSGDADLTGSLLAKIIVRLHRI